MRKIWIDGSNADSLRPASITATLYADGVPTSNTVTLQDSNSWAGSISGLPKYKNGSPIAYEYIETSVPEGYAATYSGSATSSQGQAITNTHIVHGSLNLTASKLIDGAAPTTETFSFTLTPKAGNPDATHSSAKTAQTVTNTAGAISFTEMRYEHADIGKTFEYEVAEVAASGTPYLYDTTRYTVVVTPKLSADGGSVEPAYTILKDSNAVSAMVFNNTHIPDGELVLSAKKNVDGQQPSADQVFSFALTLSGAGTPAQTKPNVGDTVTFEPLHFTAEQAIANDELTYTITEYASMPGYIKDDTVYTVTVKPQLAADSKTVLTPFTVQKTVGGVTIDLGTSLEAIEFDNHIELTTATVTKIWEHGINEASYRPTSVSMQLLKTVNGITSPVQGKTVTLTVANKDSVDDNKWSATLDNLPKYEDAHEITYSFRELGAPAGYTPSYESDGLTVKNTFSAKTNSTQLLFWGKKTINGAPAPTGSTFGFSWYQVEGTTEAFLDHVYSEGPNIDLGGWEFGEEDSGKTYTFRIREDNDTTNGYMANETYYDIVVSIARDSMTTLKATTTIKRYTKSGDAYAEEVLVSNAEDISSYVGESNTIITFDNTPLPNTALALSAQKYVDRGKLLDGGTTYDGSIPELTDEDSQPTGEYPQFTFVLTGVNENAIAKVNAIHSDTDNKNTKTTAQDNSDNGEVQFDELTFSTADLGKVFVFEITEDAASTPEEFVTDTAVYRVTVTPRVSGDGNSIEVTPVITRNGAEPAADFIDGTTVVFNNTQIEMGAVEFPIKKTVSNTTPTGNQKFAFALVLDSIKCGAEDVTTENAFRTGDYLDVRTNTDTTIDTGAAQSNFAFTDIDFEVGDVGLTYTFKVIELSDINQIPNDYDPPQDSVDGHLIKLSDGYQIPRGYAYDKTVYKVVVTPELSPDGTKVIANPVYVRNDELYSGDLAFNNEPIAPAVVNLAATKTVDGATPRQRENGLFRFTLTAADALSQAKLPASTEARNEFGDVTFDAMTFTWEDVGTTFTYNVQEVVDALVPYAQDRGVYTVYITPQLSPDGTRVVAEPVYTRTQADGTPATASAMAFANQSITPVALQLKATKQVDGAPATATYDGAFTFTLTDTTPGAPLAAVLQTKTNTAADITFDALTFDWQTVGKTFTYEVAEVNNPNNDFAESTTVYAITVNPQLMGNTIVLSVNIRAKGSDGPGTTLVATAADFATQLAQALTFNNRTVQHAELALSASKTVAHAAPSEYDSFRFLLKDESGMVVQSQLNNAGMVTFNLAFAWEDVDELAPRTYTYEVVEDTDANSRGYVVDGSEYKVTVTPRVDRETARVVVDDVTVATPQGDVVLHTTAADFATQMANLVKFDNTPVQPATLRLPARKLLNGAANPLWVSFEYSLTGDKGVNQHLSRAGSSFTFEPIEFTWEDVGQTYTFTVAETPDSGQGGTFSAYDNTAYTVAVTPRLSADRKQVELTSVISHTGEVVEGITFVNEGTPDSPPPVPPAPDKPDEPDEPENPDDPDGPTDPPDDPANPETPDNPSPQQPGEPATPANPTTPQPPAQQQATRVLNRTPQTGDYTPLVPLVVIMVGAGAAAIIIRRKRN